MQARARLLFKCGRVRSCMYVCVFGGWGWSGSCFAWSCEGSEDLAPLLVPCGEGWGVLFCSFRFVVLVL